MTSTIRSLLDKFYPSKRDKVLIAGLGYTGKTTLLYFLKTGEIVKTIPSIGFNVEDLSIPISGASQGTLNVEAWDVGTGCAGPQYLANIVRWYVPKSKAIIWMVDSSNTDKEWLADSGNTLQTVLTDADVELASQSKNPKPLPILILANKSDAPNALSLDEIRKAHAHATSGRIVSVYQTSLAHKDGPQGLTEAFSWLDIAMNIAATAKVGAPGPEVPVKPKTPAPGTQAVENQSPRSPSILAKRLETWLHQIETDSSPEEFISQFNAYNLPSWDHYTHIRLAYLLLMGHGRQKGKDLIFEGLSNYISHNQSSQTNVRGFHFTMTYFWIQMVHFGIRNMPPHLIDHDASRQPTSQSSSGTNATTVHYPSSSDFFRFLFLNPHLVDGNFWSDYYSKEVIMTPQAKASMVLPDKKPLPSLVIRDTITSFGNKR